MKNSINNSFLRATFKSKKKYIFWISSGLFISSYIFLTLQIVSSGSKLSLLEKEKEKIVKSNQEMTSALIQSTSLTKLEEKSGELGYYKPDKPLYLSAEGSVAKLP